MNQPLYPGVLADRRQTSLKDLYSVPPDYSEASSLARLAFERGLQQDQSWPTATLERAVTELYGETLRLKVEDGCFSREPELWIHTVDHAFILGQLTSYFAKTHGDAVLEKAHLVEAAHVFKRAISWGECAHWILHLRAYTLPVEAKETIEEPAAACRLCSIQAMK